MELSTSREGDDKREHYRLQFDGKAFWLDGSKLALSPLELNFMKYLYEHAPKPCDRESCASAIWGNDFINDPNIIDNLNQLVSDLRLKKLSQRDDDPVDTKFILTIRRIGFALNPNPAPKTILTPVIIRNSEDQADDSEDQADDSDNQLWFWITAIGTLLLAVSAISTVFPAYFLLLLLLIESMNFYLMLGYPYLPSFLPRWIGPVQSSVSALLSIVLLKTLEESTGLWICFLGLILIMSAGINTYISQSSEKRIAR